MTLFDEAEGELDDEQADQEHRDSWPAGTYSGIFAKSRHAIELGRRWDKALAELQDRWSKQSGKVAEGVDIAVSQLRLIEFDLKEFG